MSLARKRVQRPRSLRRGAGAFSTGLQGLGIHFLFLLGIYILPKWGFQILYWKRGWFEGNRLTREAGRGTLSGRCVSFQPRPTEHQPRIPTVHFLRMRSWSTMYRKWYWEGESAARALQRCEGPRYSPRLSAWSSVRCIEHFLLDSAQSAGFWLKPCDCELRVRPGCLSPLVSSVPV